jgi:hypothetical protein
MQQRCFVSAQEMRMCGAPPLAAASAVPYVAISLVVYRAT